MEASSQPLTFKIMLAGASRTGKTCFVRRHRTGEFRREHFATMGCEVHPLVFHTTHGVIVFKVWDLAGAPEYAGLGDGYYQGAQGLIVFYDLSAPLSLVKAAEVLDAHPSGLARVLCGAKLDLVSGRGAAGPGAAAATSKPYPGVPYYELSSRSNYNYEKPFLTLARALTGHRDLEFAEAPPVEVPLVSQGAHLDTGPVDFAAGTTRLVARGPLEDLFTEYGSPLEDRLSSLELEAGRAGYGMVVSVSVAFEALP